MEQPASPEQRTSHRRSGHSCCRVLLQPWSLGISFTHARHVPMCQGLFQAHSLLLLIRTPTSLPTYHLSRLFLYILTPHHPQVILFNYSVDMLFKTVALTHVYVECENIDSFEASFELVFFSQPFCFLDENIQWRGYKTDAHVNIYNSKLPLPFWGNLWWELLNICHI